VPGLGGEQPRVGGEIELSPIVAPLYDEAGKARVHLDAIDLEPSGSKRALGGGNETIHGLTREAEEVEVARLAPDVAARDQRSSTSEGKLPCLLEARDDLRDLLLERAEHLLAARTPPQPGLPRAPNRRRKHDLVEDLA
jgi:hypothetical protein